ncbi:hypothetical protein [uncultured Mediterranean phage uvMED]|nr:hypothetical protein [uncultured Mediterranean phage uvMED]
MSEIKVDTVAEKTSANGVTVDGLNIKDGKLTTATAITGHTAEATVANDDLVLVSDTSASGALKKMTVANLTANAGVAGISSSADATAMTISSNENVGIGITDPDSYDSTAHELVVGKTDAESGITIRSSSTAGNIYFADGTSGAEKYQGYVQYDHNNGRLNLGSGGSTHTSFDDSGTLQMGTTSTQASTPNIYIHAAGAMLFLQRKTSNGHIASFINTAGSVNGRIDIDGSNTTYATSSDHRLKENVDYNWDATTRLKQLKPARFNWISDENNTLQDGFIAHEVSDVVPKAVIGSKDATETYTDENGVEQTRPAYQSIDHSMLVPLLVKTIQELEARITTLENA